MPISQYLTSACVQCNKMVAAELMPSHLFSHRHQIMGKRLYFCEICRIGFISGSARQNHMAVEHPGADLKKRRLSGPIACGKLCKDPPTADHLQIHKKRGHVPIVSPGNSSSCIYPCLSTFSTVKSRDVHLKRYH